MGLNASPVERPVIVIELASDYVEREYTTICERSNSQERVYRNAADMLNVRDSVQHGQRLK